MKTIFVMVKCDLGQAYKVADAAVAEDNVAVFPRQAAERRPDAGRRPERRQSEPEHRVVGFGDHLPAFLRRVPKVAAQA